MFSDSAHWFSVKFVKIFHKSGDNRVIWYCRTQKISQMWFFGLLAVRSKYPSERKNLTQQLNHNRWLESQVFVTRLPLQLCQKWSDFGSVKAKMTRCTLLSMQSLLMDIFGPILIDSFSLEDIITQNLLLACSQNTFFNITLRNQKMGSQIFYML